LIHKCSHIKLSIFLHAPIRIFHSKLHVAGITVPIVPGIMCITSFSGMKKMSKMCKTRVPETLSKRLDELKDNDMELKQFGIDYGVAMCRRLLQAGAPGLHFYTLNSSIATSAIIDKLDISSL